MFCQVIIVEIYKTQKHNGQGNQAGERVSATVFGAAFMERRWLSVVLRRKVVFSHYMPYSYSSGGAAGVRPALHLYPVLHLRFLLIKSFF